MDYSYFYKVGFFLGACDDFSVECEEGVANPWMKLGAIGSRVNFLWVACHGLFAYGLWAPTGR